MGGHLGQGMAGGSIVGIVNMTLEDDMTKLRAGAGKTTAYLVHGPPNVTVGILLLGDASSGEGLVELLVFFAEGLLEERKRGFVIVVVDYRWKGHE